LYSKATVLIVEDDITSAAFISESLADKYLTHIVNSGEDALAFCSSTPPDLILMDINMPSMDGVAACRHLKDSFETEHIPVVFLTACTELEYEDLAWEAGCADFVTKPFSPSALMRRINHHLEVKLLTDKLKRQANIDGLTGVKNRRAFDLAIQEQVKLGQRIGWSIGLLMIDIDYFKQYNDTYGHLKGDDCLVTIATILTSVVVRPTDHVARYGGEEFVVLLPDTDKHGMKHVAENIMSAIRARKIEHKTSPLHILTVSIGGISELAKNTDEKVVVKQADKLLYKAKESGRNCIKTANG